MEELNNINITFKVIENENYKEIEVKQDSHYTSVLPDSIIPDTLKDNQEFMDLYNEVFTEEVKVKYNEYLDSLKPSQEEIDKIEAERIQAEIKSKRDAAMLEGEVYTLNEVEYKVSFTKNDGDGLVQVKSAFELGLTETIIKFENGTLLPIKAENFLEFAYWFVNKRNSFFIGV